MAGMPYPPNLCASVLICGRLFSARRFRVCVLWEYLFSHRFLLRRVWHLAIPTPPAMGYSPTEYAEFTEPPTEMSSHGFHRFTQILRVRCSPTEFGSVGMAGMPYPPNLCSSVSSVGGSSLPEVSVRSVRSVGISFLPRISQICTDT